MRAPRVLDVRTVAEFLRSVRPLDGLTEEQLARLARHSSVEQYEAGEVVFDAFASSPGQLFAVWRGQVDLWVRADRLSELPDESVPSGQLFGYTAALVGEAVGPRAVASTETVVVRLDAELGGRHLPRRAARGSWRRRCPKPTAVTWACPATPSSTTWSSSRRWWWTPTPRLPRWPRCWCRRT